MSIHPHPTHPGWWQVKYYPEWKKGGAKVVVLRDCTLADAWGYLAGVVERLTIEADEKYSDILFPEIEDETN